MICGEYPTYGWMGGSMGVARKSRHCHRHVHMDGPPFLPRLGGRLGILRKVVSTSSGSVSALGVILVRGLILLAITLGVI